MLVWLHSSSPPQHIANVTEHEVATSAKLRTYMEGVNERRLVNLKWGGLFETPRGEVICCLFWDRERAMAYVERNRKKGLADLLISTDD